jgi:ABC-type enterochelin transport system ATPase subunit
MALLKVENLTKAFGGVTAISKLHFNVPDSQVYSVIGPNGAGKTRAALASKMWRSSANAPTRWPRWVYRAPFRTCRCFSI